MRIIFMGTPDFSVGTLEALVEAGHDVCLAVTQPDKPKGRGKEMQFTPVKEAAVKHGILVYQPKRVRDPECVEELRKYNADVMVVVAFGQILPKEILEMTPYGCINVHASLLPKYRGAAPIQWAIIEGESVTGVTTMQMDEGLDTGDMILKTEIPIAEDETGESLHDKLAEAGAALCVKTLHAIENKTAVFEKQPESPTAYAKCSRKDLGQYRLGEIGSADRASRAWIEFMAKRIYTPGRKSDEDMESVGKATGRMCRANRTGKRGTYSAENREERHAGNGSVRSKRFVLHTDGRRRASYFRSTDARQETNGYRLVSARI